MSNTINRGEFIRRVSLAGSSLVMSPYLASGAEIFKGAPNTKVVMGIMGTNSRGLFLAKAFAKLPNVEVAYICDPDATVLAKTIKEMETHHGKKTDRVCRYPQNAGEKRFGWTCHCST